MIAAIVRTLPLLLLLVVLSPALLVGPLLTNRQRFTLRLLAALQQWATACIDLDPPPGR